MAGNRPSDWHVLDLERDPTPGDPDRVRLLSKNLLDFADDVGDALRLIKGMADEEAVLQWAGKSAKAFQDQFSGVPKQLKKLRTSYDMAGVRWRRTGRSWSVRRPSPTGRWPTAVRRRPT